MLTGLIPLSKRAAAMPNEPAAAWQGRKAVSELRKTRFQANQMWKVSHIAGNPFVTIGNPMAAKADYFGLQRRNGLARRIAEWQHCTGYGLLPPHDLKDAAWSAKR